MPRRCDVARSETTHWQCVADPSSDYGTVKFSVIALRLKNIQSVGARRQEQHEKKINYKEPVDRLKNLHLARQHFFSETINSDS